MEYQKRTFLRRCFSSISRTCGGGNYCLDSQQRGGNNPLDTKGTTLGAAFLWGVVGGSSLFFGGLLALNLRISQRVLGFIMAFGAGVLISAVSYELVQEAVGISGSTGTGLGLFSGALVFFAGDLLIDRFGGNGRKASTGACTRRAVSDPVQRTGAGLAITLGIILDGVPESAVLGLTLLEGSVGIAMLAAVFLSNLPEAIAATLGLSDSGWSNAQILGLWVAVAVVSGIAALAGYGIFGGAQPGAISFVLAFAGGAILTMLADTMMPEAFEHGRMLVGLFTTLGFALAFALSSLQ
jgi:zinc transporter, ZIP family